MYFFPKIIVFYSLFFKTFFLFNRFYDGLWFLYSFYLKLQINHHFFPLTDSETIIICDLKRWLKNHSFIFSYFFLSIKGTSKSSHICALDISTCIDIAADPLDRSSTIFILKNSLIMMCRFIATKENVSILCLRLCIPAPIYRYMYVMKSITLYSVTLYVGYTSQNLRRKYRNHCVYV